MKSAMLCHPCFYGSPDRTNRALTLERAAALSYFLCSGAKIRSGERALRAGMRGKAREGSVDFANETSRLLAGRREVEEEACEVWGRGRAGTTYPSLDSSEKGRKKAPLMKDIPALYSGKSGAVVGSESNSEALWQRRYRLSVSQTPPRGAGGSGVGLWSPQPDSAHLADDTRLSCCWKTLLSSTGGGLQIMVSERGSSGVWMPPADWTVSVMIRLSVLRLDVVNQQRGSLGSVARTK